VGDDSVPGPAPGANLPGVDLSDGVAARVASLCLGENGRLSEKLLCGTAVRGGLLLDLALAGRVESAEDSVVIDQTPIGFGPADRLLAAIAIEPERSLDGWLDEQRIGLRDVAEANVASGRWASRSGPLGFGRRFSDLRPGATARDRTRQADDETQPWSPADACVIAVAAAAGLQDVEVWAPGRRPDEVLGATGPVAWLAGAVVDHVLVAGARYRSQAAALGTGGFGPF
jgi:hypothetical protein